MAAGKKKYYVVWAGRIPGIYDDWRDAKEQIDNYPNPRYKGFTSAAEAAEAFRKGMPDSAKASLGDFLARAGQRSLPKAGQPDYMTIPEVDLNAWAVDASCMGNPGIMEYQGVELMTGRTLFRVGPFPDATNNIGEFLAIVHAMALMEREGTLHNIYSDSVSGMAWVRNRKIKTQLKPTEKNRKVFELMARAITWLNSHQYRGKVMKWQTDLWGEIPADFGRK